MDIIFIVFVFVILFGIQKTKRLDPVSNITLLLFNLYWFFSLALSITGLNNFFVPQTKTIIMLLCGVCMFNAGFYLIKVTRKEVQSFNNQCLVNSFDTVFSSIWLKIFVVITGVYVVYVMSQYYQLLLIEQISGGEMRASMSNQTFDVDVPFSSVFSLIYPWLIPLVRVMFCYSVLYKRNIFTVFLFILLFVYSSLAFGRMMYIIAILPIIILIGFFQSKNNKIIISGKQRVFFISMIIALIVALSFVSSLRLSSLDETSMQDGFEMTTSQITDYSSGAVVGFDAALKDDYVRRTGGFKYGMVSFWPYLFPFTTLSHLLGGYEYATGEWAYLSDYIERYYPKVRNNGGTWNGLFTWNILFYDDFGFLGIIFLNFLFGLIMRYSIKRVYKNQSFLSVVICSIFFIMTVLSPTKLWGYENLFGVVLFVFWIIDSIQCRRKEAHHLKKLKANVMSIA